MGLWSDVYFLKSNAGVSDIWNCLRKVFSDFSEKFVRLTRLLQS